MGFVEAGRDRSRLQTANRLLALTILQRPRNVVGLQPADQRATRNAQLLGRARLIATAASECIDDVLTLHRLHVPAQLLTVGNTGVRVLRLEARRSGRRHDGRLVPRGSIDTGRTERRRTHVR